MPPNQVGLIDEKIRDDCLAMENTTRQLIMEERWEEVALLKVFIANWLYWNAFIFLYKSAYYTW